MVTWCLYDWPKTTLSLSDAELEIDKSSITLGLYPPFSQFQRSNEVNYNILDQFFRYGWNDTGKGYSIADTGNIEGSAFESWDWSDDKRSLTLTLRKGANFNSTGNSVTSADVLYWFERA